MRASRKNAKPTLLRRVLACLVSAAMVVAFTPVVAWGDGTTVTVGSLTIRTADSSGLIQDADYTYSADSSPATTSTLTIKSGKAITISGTTTADHIVVASDVTADITLNGVDIQFNDGESGISGTCAFEISPGAKVNLTLVGDNTLKSGYWRAGLQVETPQSGTAGTLVITETSNGSLTATGGFDGAGIGGGNQGSGGAITITGGTVTATGGDYGAGIGSGSKGSGGTIKITGGTVNATGGDGSAGIGGGNQGSGGAITITGGTVTAAGSSSTDSGAGIGGGGCPSGSDGSSGGTIAISGGVIEATGGNRGAGIGGGTLSSDANVTITGGIVTATGGNGAGIGGGGKGKSTNVNISGGTVTATGRGGAGIGNGYQGEGGAITISGGAVTATSKKGGAGIGGGGGGGSGGTVAITGGAVTATGTSENGNSGAGIGGGWNGSGSSTVLISGGTVTAASTGGAGIGKGNNSPLATDGTFKTQETDATRGNAVIFASSTSGKAISDTSNQNIWSGVIFEGDSGKVYGDQTLTKALTIDTGKTLTVPNGVTLTVPSGVTLTNGGTVVNEGAVSGSGSISNRDLLVDFGTSPTSIISNSGGQVVNKPQAASDLVYSGTAQALATTSSTYIQYSLDGADWSTDPPKATSADTYYVYYRAVKDSDQVISSVLTLTVKIGKASSTVATAPTALSPTYTGSEHALVTAGAATGGTMQYRLGDSGDWSGAIPTAKDAGTYTVYYKVVGYANHTDTAESSLTVTISPKQITVTITPNGGTYAGAIAPASAVAKGVIESDRVPVTLTYTGTANDGTSCNSTTAPTLAGTYTVTASISDANYELTGTTTAKFTVAKATVATPAVGSKVYNGSNQTADVPASSLYTVSENVGDTDAGSYDVVLQLTDSNNYQWDAAGGRTAFKITQATNSWTTTPAIDGWTYGETAAAPVSAATFGAATVEYRPASSGDAAYSTTVPTSAGSYTARFTVAETNNYTGLSEERGFTIALREVGIQWGATLLTYSGQPQSPTAIAINTVNNDEIALIVDGAQIDAGTYTATVTDITGGAKANYKLPTVTTTSFTISSAASSLTTAPAAKAGLVYSGSAQELVSAGAATGGTMQYSFNGTDWSTELPTATSAGTYTVRYKVVGDANHTDIAEASLSVTISPRQITSVALAAGSSVYDASSHTPAIQTVTAGGLAVTASDYTVSYQSSTGGSADELKSAGTYKVVVTARNGSNYCGTAETGYTINPKQITVTITPNGGTYGGSITPASATLNGVVSGDSVPVTLTYTGTANDGTNVSGTAAPTKAGSYTVTASISDANYELTGTTTAEFVVAKATVATPTVDSKVYNGSNQTADVPGNSLYTVSDNAGGTDAGSYDVVLQLTDPNNYQWDAAGGKAAFKITRADNAWTTEPAITGWTYGSRANDPAGAAKFGTVKVEYRLASDTDASFSETVPVNAGDYKARFTVAATGNYTGLSEERDLTIDKAAPNLKIEPSKTALYGGGSITLTVDNSDLPDSCQASVVCDDVNVAVTPSGNGAFTAKLPNSTKDYTFTASYEDANRVARATCTVSVTVYVPPSTPQVSADCIKAIDALPDVDAITLEDGEAIEAARSAYDALTTYQKSFVPAASVTKLEAAEARYADLVAVAPVEAALAALPVADELKAKDAKAAVKAAKRALKQVSKLTESQRELVDEQLVANAENVIAQGEKLIAKADKKAVKRVKNKAFSVKYGKSKVIIFKTKKSTAGTKVVYKKTKGSKLITVTKSGKMTAKKGLKVGKHTVKIKVICGKSYKFVKVVVVTVG